MAEVLVALLAASLLALAVSGLRPARCSECGRRALLRPSRPVLSCRACPGGVLVYPGSFLVGLLARPALVRPRAPRRRRSS